MSSGVCQLSCSGSLPMVSCTAAAQRAGPSPGCGAPSSGTPRKSGTHDSVLNSRPPVPREAAPERDGVAAAEDERVDLRLRAPPSPARRAARCSRRPGAARRRRRPPTRRRRRRCRTGRRWSCRSTATLRQATSSVELSPAVASTSGTMPAGRSASPANVSRTEAARCDPSGTSRTVGRAAVSPRDTRRRGRASSRAPAPSGSAAARRTASAARACANSGFSSSNGNSLTPVIASSRTASLRLRSARLSASFSATSPFASAAGRPPAASMDWNSAHPAFASASVSDSTYQEPPAGSMTAATCDSSMISACVLRAMRRPRVSGRPMAASNGSTVTASAPPTPAANAATVVRSMFTYGSRRVIIGHDVTACCSCPW